MTEAKNRLSALLDRVRHGETVLIEDRGRVVAQISPVARVEAGSTATGSLDWSAAASSVPHSCPRRAPCC